MCNVPSESSCPGLGTRRQLSGPGGRRSGIPSLSSSSSHSSPRPSLSVSSWELLMTAGQLSRESWCPSPSLRRRDAERAQTPIATITAVHRHTDITLWWHLCHTVIAIRSLVLCCLNNDSPNFSMPQLNSLFLPKKTNLHGSHTVAFQSQKSAKCNKYSKQSN